MKQFIAWLQSFAAAIGGPGLFIIAFLDSSFLALPEINDLLVVSAVMRHPYRLVYYAAMATAGSIAGCLALYAVGRRGGNALVRSRFGTGRMASAAATIQRHGVLAILVPSLLPPPAPFKIFILLAGVAGIPIWKFVVALLIGRGTRFLLLGILAARYGQQAVDFLHEHQRMAGLVVVALVVAGAAIYFWRQRRA
jgi:membrane protein YqaA with SNARE-associated domain